MNIINVILSAAISSFFAIFSIANMSNTKITFKKFLTFMIIMLIFGTIICANFEGVSRIILTIVVTTIALYVSLFSKNFAKSLYYAFVYELFAFVVELILSIIFVSIFNFSLDSYNNFSLSLLMFSILNSLIIYLLSKMSILDNKIINFNKIISKKKYEVIYIIIIVMLLILLMTFNKTNLQKDLKFYINIGMTIFVFVTLIYIIRRDFQNEKLESKYNEMMEYVCKYEKIINEQGKKNHEYNNQLMVIKGYSHNPKKLEEYLSLIIEEHKCGQNYTIRQLSYFPDGGIKGLIYDKLSKMEENNIKSLLYIDQNVKDAFEDKFGLKTYQDITKLLGVFLDNAIEATLEADPKEIELEIKADSDCAIITIGNTYNTNADIKQVGKKGFTTKGIGHGYGLSIVKDISKHNNSIETFKDISDNRFKQTIIVYYENK